MPRSFRARRTSIARLRGRGFNVELLEVRTLLSVSAVPESAAEIRGSEPDTAASIEGADAGRNVVGPLAKADTNLAAEPVRREIVPRDDTVYPIEVCPGLDPSFCLPTSPYQGPRESLLLRKRLIVTDHVRPYVANQGPLRTVSGGALSSARYGPNPDDLQRTRPLRSTRLLIVVEPNPDASLH